MAHNIMFEREVRAPGGAVYTEVFTSETDEINGFQENTFMLELPSPGGAQRITFTKSWRHATATNAYEDVADTMPAWWRSPRNAEDLAEKYRNNGNKRLPTTGNVVTFATYLTDGRLCLQERDYVSKEGKPIGNPGKRSLNGGVMESYDIKANLRREAMEELGVDIGCYFRREGDIYDAEAGRSNHVYRITVGYEEMLGWQYETQEAIKRLVGSPWENIGEGIGRTFVYAENLEAMIEKGGLTPISVAILKAFPSLMPSARP